MHLQQEVSKPSAAAGENKLQKEEEQTKMVISTHKFDQQTDREVKQGTHKIIKANRTLSKRSANHQQLQGWRNKLQKEEEQKKW